jgi:NAD(P)-dependent dehydrogenase (short-subunit alcohol dehydrogenase family)
MKDKVVVITGAGRGLGKSLAYIFAKKGAQVILSDKTSEEITNIADEISGIAIVADVTDEQAVVSLTKIAVSKFGHIDYWINNAGIWIPRGPVEELQMNRVRELIDVNLYGTIHGSKTALIQMKKQGFGTIVNIISTSALQGRALSAAYSASKHAARGFTDSLREEVKDQNIKVIAVYPGGMKTHLFDEKKPDDFDQFMSAESVTSTIIENLEKDIPEGELILKRPGQQ